MKTIAAILAVAAAALLTPDFSEAKRVSGGRSLGAQRPAAPAQQAVPPSQAGAPAAGNTMNAAPATPPGTGAASNPVMAPSGASAARPTAPAAASAAAATPGRARSSWMGPVAGLAAGLGLAALASYMGFSDELASILLILLLTFAAVVVVRMVMSRRSPARSPLPYAGAGAGLGTTPGGYETQVPPPARFEPAPRGSAFGGPPLAAPGSRALPAGFDADGFAREARRQFLAVQSAHDRHDEKSLADVMTPELLREILSEMNATGAARPTEIVDVDAEVVDVATDGSKHWASVRFTGTAREGGVLEPFDEVWNLVKPVDGSSGWLIAGIQQQVMPS